MTETGTERQIFMLDFNGGEVSIKTFQLVGKDELKVHFVRTYRMPNYLTPEVVSTVLTCTS